MEYIEGTKNYVRFTADKTVTFGSDDWAVYIKVSNGDDEAGAVFSIGDAQRAVDILNKAIDDAKNAPSIAEVMGDANPFGGYYEQDDDDVE